MPGETSYQPVDSNLNINPGLVNSLENEIDQKLMQKNMQQQSPFAQPTMSNINIIPNQQIYGQQEMLTSPPIVSNSEFTQSGQVMPIGSYGLGQQQFIGQNYEMPASLQSGAYLQNVNMAGLNNQIPISQGVNGLPQGQMLQSGFGMPLNHGFIEYPQGQFIQGQPEYNMPLNQDFNKPNLGQVQDTFQDQVSKEEPREDDMNEKDKAKEAEKEASKQQTTQSNEPLEGTTQGYYNQGNLGKISGINGAAEASADLPTSKATDPADVPVSSKTSLFGPSGGFPHGHHILGGATNGGYSVRPGYTLGAIESNPTTQANLDTNGGGLFNRPERYRRAEPYSLSNPGTYGIPYGQTVDASGHLRPEVALTRQAPIGMMDRPGYTGYVDDFDAEEEEYEDAEEKPKKKHRFFGRFRR